MNYLYLITIINLLFCCPFFCQTSCNIDTIYYKEYEVNYFYNDDRYTDINLMMTEKNLKKDWIVIYRDNKIYQRKLGSTMGGSNRAETFYYDNKGRLDSIYDNGGFELRYKFFYNSKGKLYQMISYSMLGNHQYFFEFKKDNVIMKSGNYEYVVNYEHAIKHSFKFGNIDFLNDTYGLADNENEEYGLKEEFKFDECQNKVLYVVRNPDTKIIKTINEFKYIYIK